jgi:hypothetical protein
MLPPLHKPDHVNNFLVAWLRGCTEKEGDELGKRFPLRNSVKLKRLLEIYNICGDD